MPTIKVHFKDTPNGEIHHIRCPNTEYRVLELLGSEEMIGPQISRASDVVVSISAIYNLLKRLEARKLVTKRTIKVPIMDTFVERVAYSRAYDREVGRNESH